MIEIQLILPWGLLSPFQTYDVMIPLLLTASIASELINRDSSVTQLPPHKCPHIKLTSHIHPFPLLSTSFPILSLSFSNAAFKISLLFPFFFFFPKWLPSLSNVSVPLFIFTFSSNQWNSKVVQEGGHFIDEDTESERRK